MKHRKDVLLMRERVGREKAAQLIEFEKEYEHRIHDWQFHYGDLVLIRDSARKMSLDRKAYNKWFGPCVVIRQTAGGSYICAELSGAVLGERIARDRVIPYFARQKIEVPPNLEEWVDISRDALRQLEAELLTGMFKDMNDLFEDVDWPGQKLSKKDKARLTVELNDTGPKN